MSRQLPQVTSNPICRRVVRLFSETDTTISVAFSDLLNLFAIYRNASTSTNRVYQCVKLEAVRIMFFSQDVLDLSSVDFTWGSQLSTGNRAPIITKTFTASTNVPFNKYMPAPKDSFVGMWFSQGDDDEYAFTATISNASLYIDLHLSLIMTNGATFAGATITDPGDDGIGVIAPTSTTVVGLFNV